METNKKSVDKGSSVILFLVLFLSAGFLVLNNYISSSSTIVLWLGVLAFLLKDLKKVNQKYFLPAFGILAWYIFSSIINGDSLYTVLACSFGFIVSLLFTSTRNFTDFQSSFIEVMKVLCIISLVGFFAFAFIPFVGQLFGSFMGYTIGGTPFYNLYIFIYKPLSLRNSGMFWEPGAFQIFINIALLFETLKTKPSIVNIAIFLVTIITTFSTTGYIVIFIIIAMILLNRSQELKKTRKIIIWFVPVLLVLFIFNSDYLTDTSSYSTFGKINSFVEGEEWKGGGEETSGSIRYYSIVRTLEAFLHSPIFGMGTEGLEKYNINYTFGMNTCTFANWFGKYGIVYGLLMLIGYIRLSSMLGYNKGGFVKFLIFVFFFTVTLSESLSESPLLNMLCLYGYNDKQILQYFKLSSH